MPSFTLSELQYSTDRKGPWRLYVYNADGTGYEVRQYFSRHIRYPDEEVPIQTAKQLTDAALAKNREVRITDGGDFLVFHAQHGRIVYGENFWKEIGAA